jgi:hypothetical protein
MLRPLKDMEGYSIGALDGFIGQVVDYYFDDVSWVIRYLAVETGDWLSSRRVLISTAVINSPNWSETNIPASITRDQVKNSPHGTPGEAAPPDLHLRSANTVMKYQIQAADGDIGHVKAILVDERSWAIRYVVVSTGVSLLGHASLIAARWIKEIDPATSKIVVSLKRQSIKDAPPYDSSMPLDRDGETRVLAHYQREGYWHGEARDEAAIPHIGP